MTTPPTPPEDSPFRPDVDTGTEVEPVEDPIPADADVKGSGGFAEPEVIESGQDTTVPEIEASSEAEIEESAEFDAFDGFEQGGTARFVIDDDGGGDAPDRVMSGQVAGRSKVSLFLLPLLGLLVGAGLTLGALSVAGVFEEEPPPIVVEPTDDTSLAALVARRAVPSIVTVQVTAPDGDGSGSGVVLSADGFILTNTHVVGDATVIEVVLSNQRTYVATLVGADRLTDVAVVRIDAPDLVPIEIGDISTVEIGDPAIAVGNPLGLRGGPSVTSGIISAFDRTLMVDPSEDFRLYGLLQTDAPITRGSSGGALLDANARLLGLTTAIGLSDVGAEGLGFAVPVTTVIEVANELIENGEVNHAFLGIRAQTNYVEASDGAKIPNGTTVETLLDESAIESAGALVGDVITSIDGYAIVTLDELISVLRGRRAGEIVGVDILRDGQSLSIEVTLDRHPEN